MTFPSDVTLCTVTIPEPTDHLGVSAKVRVQVDPSHMLVHQASGVALVKIAREIAEDASGDIILHLPHTDQPGFVDHRGNTITGWSYKIQVFFQGAGGKSSMVMKEFNLPTGVASMNPLLINDGPPVAAVITASPTVTSLGGYTGVVTPDQLASLIIAAEPVVDGAGNLLADVNVLDVNLPAGAKVADIAGKLDKTEAASTYATPATVTEAVAPKLDKTEAAQMYATPANIVAAVAPKLDADKVGQLPERLATVAATPATLGTPYAGGYDRTTNVYNLKPAHLRRTRAKLAAARAGTGTATVATLGESTTAGWLVAPGTQSWPAALRTMLVNSGVPSTGTGPVAAFTNTGDPRVTIGSGWVPFSLMSNFLMNDSTTDALTLADPNAAGTVVKVVYSDSSGPFTITIDGGAPVTVTPAGSYTLATHTITGLPNTVHTVSVARSSGAVLIYSIEVANTTGYGLRLFNGAISGNVVDTLNRADFWSITSYTTYINADLVTLQIMVNDKVAGTTAATWKTHMQAAIDAVQVNGADILLIAAPPADGLDFTEYRRAAYELADTNDLPLLDMTDRWGDYTTANTYGLMADGWHAGPAGHADEARALMVSLGL